MGEPAFACTEVEFMASGVKAVYPVTEWADEVEVRIQLARVDPRFSPSTRESPQRNPAFVATCVVVSHVVARDRVSRASL